MLDGQSMLCSNAANSNPSTWAKLMTTTASSITLHQAVRKRQQPMFHGNVCLLKTKNVIKQKWEHLSAAVKEASNITVTVPFAHFKKMPYKKKNGLIVERLKTLKEDVNINFITDSIDKILPKTIYLRNHLKHFRSVHH